MTIDQSDMEWALSRLIPADSLTSLSGLHRELDTAIAVGMAHGIPALLTEYWTRLLHARLSTSGHRPPLAAGLGAQIDAAVRAGLPATAGILAAFRLAAMWQATAQTRTPADSRDAGSLETARLSAVTLKVMIDRAVFDWAGRLAA